MDISQYPSPGLRCEEGFLMITNSLCFEQQVKFKSQLEQQKLQLQREHSTEMEQILEKVRRKIILIF